MHFLFKRHSYYVFIYYLLMKNFKCFTQLGHHFGLSWYIFLAAKNVVTFKY